MVARREDVLSPESVFDLTVAAASGDREAWNELVRCFSGMITSITHRYGLKGCDASDVAQTTWLRLLEHIGQIQNPERVGGWLATTASRECLRVLRLSGRQVPVAEVGWFDGAVVEDHTDEMLVAHEHEGQLRDVLDRLPDRSRRLLNMLFVADPAPSYAQISRELEMPVGSIGPTRARCLDTVRRMMSVDLREDLR